MDAVGGLASEKWAESRRRAAAAAAGAIAAAQRSKAASDAFAGYGSDSDVDGHATQDALLGSVAGYGSESDEEVQHHGSKQCAEAEGGAATSQLCDSRDGAGEDQEDLKSPPAKRKKLLPASSDALSSAVPAVEDRLALQPKEPTNEERRAAVNAEQAQRIQELFFWYSSLVLLLIPQSLSTPCTSIRNITDMLVHPCILLPSHHTRHQNRSPGRTTCRYEITHSKHMLYENHCTGLQRESRHLPFQSPSHQPRTPRLPCIPAFHRHGCSSPSSYAPSVAQISHRAAHWGTKLGPRGHSCRLQASGGMPCSTLASWHHSHPDLIPNHHC